MRLPIVYLDSSTLADAFGAVHLHTPSGHDAYERLYILIGKVSAEGSLCYSTTHLEELLQDRMREYPPELLENVISERTVQALESRARQLWPTLVEERPGLSEEDVVSVARTLVNQPDAIPLDRLMIRTLGQLAKKVTAQDADSRAFRRRYRSATHDIMHLTGAAYGDIFTCDRRIDEAIGNFRTDRSFPPQLSVRGEGGADAFVEALEQQVAHLTKTA